MIAFIPAFAQSFFAYFLVTIIIMGIFFAITIGAIGGLSWLESRFAPPKTILCPHCGKRL